jgi:hypothetical protein
VEAFDLFGAGLAAADFDGDGACDLAVGVPGEPVFEAHAGALQAIYGVLNLGLTDAGNQYFNQTLFGAGQLSEAFEGFGRTVRS